jgi:excinuclease ABC subunit C
VSHTEGTDVSSLFPDGSFAGFGPSRLNPWPKPPGVQQVEGRRTSQLRARLRQECPRSPGVYGMVDGSGELIYVGKAKSLRARLLTYFCPRSRAPKARRILSATRLIAWEYAPSEFAALLRELELIRRHQPVFNIQGQPHRFRRTYVCLGRRPAPCVFLSRRPPMATLAFWGPVFACKRAREAVRRVNDSFGLRDCPQPQEMIFAEQGELFPVIRAAGCIRHEIGTCLGPCAAACTESAYAERVIQARTFLDGTNLTLLEQLRNDMNEAARLLAFERAAMLREKLAALEWLQRHLERVRQARQRNHFIYPVTGRNGQDLWYLLRQGWVAAAVPVPRDETTRRAAQAAIEQVYSRSAHNIMPAWSEEIDGVLLAAAWFRRHPKELDRVLTPEEARAMCRRVVSGEW